MFGRKVTAEEVMKLFAQLSDDEKAKVLDGLKKPEAEDEAQPAETEERAEETGEESGTNDQTEQAVEGENAGEQEQQDGDEDPQDTDESAAEEESEEVAQQAEETSTEAEPAEADAQTEENGEDVLVGLAERVSALESALKEFGELKAKMEEFTAKQAENFGYKGKAFGGNKDMKDMSADELKDKILQGK